MYKKIINQRLIDTSRKSSIIMIIIFYYPKILISPLQHLSLGFMLFDWYLIEMSIIWTLDRILATVILIPSRKIKS